MWWGGGGVVESSQAQQHPQPVFQPPPRDRRRDEGRKANFRQEEEGWGENREQSESWQGRERIGRVHGRKQTPPEVLVENGRKTRKILGHLGAAESPLGTLARLSAGHVAQEAREGKALSDL